MNCAISCSSPASVISGLPFIPVKLNSSDLVVTPDESLKNVLPATENDLQQSKPILSELISAARPPCEKFHRMKRR